MEVSSTVQGSSSQHSKENSEIIQHSTTQCGSVSQQERKSVRQSDSQTVRQSGTTSERVSELHWHKRCHYAMNEDLRGGRGRGRGRVWGISQSVSQ